MATKTPDRIDSFRGKYYDLSNFGPSGLRMYSQLEERWIEFPSGEHAFHWAKSLDPEERAKVLAAPTRRKAKEVGQKVKLRPGWDHGISFLVMRMVVDAKFQPGTSAAELLLSTGNAELIEGNDWHDQIWGDCRCGEEPYCAKPGENLLGKILMECRAELRARRARPVLGEE
jgi:ribA/ribD-fused uncharacterized protein